MTALAMKHAGRERIKAFSIGFEEASFDETRYAREVTPRIVVELEKFFDMPYPYGKLDVAVVPRFWGTMEHPGIVALGQPLTLIKPTEDLSITPRVLLPHTAATRRRTATTSTTPPRLRWPIVRASRCAATRRKPQNQISHARDGGSGATTGRAVFSRLVFFFDLRLIRSHPQRLLDAGTRISCGSAQRHQSA